MIRNLFSSLLYVDDPTVLNDAETQLEVDIMRKMEGESENETTENTQVSAKSQATEQDVDKENIPPAAKRQKVENKKKTMANTQKKKEKTRKDSKAKKVIC